MQIKKFFHRRRVVVGSIQRQFGERLRHAGTRRDSERRQARARFGKKTIRVAVIAAVEFDDQVAARGGARQAHGAHGRLGARADKSHFFARRKRFSDARRKFDFEFGGHAVTRATARLLGDRLNDLRMRVTQNQRAPRANVIDVFVSVGVPQARAGGAIDDDGFAAHGAKCAHGAVHSADEHVSRAAEYFVGVRPLHFYRFG